MIKKPVKPCVLCLTNPAEQKYLHSEFNVICSSCSEDVGQCFLCGKKIGLSSSHNTCFGLRICEGCDWELGEETYEIKKFPKSAAELKNEKMYKKFLQRKAYPEVKVWHKAIDGVETTDPVRDKKFFL